MKLTYFSLILSFIILILRSEHRYNDCYQKIIENTTTNFHIFGSEENVDFWKMSMEYNIIACYGIFGRMEALCLTSIKYDDLIPNKINIFSTRELQFYDNTTCENNNSIIIRNLSLTEPIKSYF